MSVPRRTIPSHRNRDSTSLLSNRPNTQVECLEFGQLTTLASICDSVEFGLESSRLIDRLLIDGALNFGFNFHLIMGHFQLISPQS